MFAFAHRAIWWLATPPPEDPLGPIDQDPDAVREEACKLVSQDTKVCSPPKPPRTSSGDSGGLDLSFVSMLLWMLFAVAVAALLYMLVRWMLARTGGGRARRGRNKSLEDDDTDVIERDAVAVDRSREPTNWRAEADEHRRAGRFRDALRCRYRALVGDLARRGLIDEIPGRTTGEERAQLRQVTPTASAPFNSAADLFDEAWYGHVDVDATDDDRFQLFERDVLASATGDRR